MADTDHALLVSTSDDSDAQQQLENAAWTFLHLLDHCGRVHRSAALEVLPDVLEELDHLSLRYGFDLATRDVLRRS